MTANKLLNKRHSSKYDVLFIRQIAYG